MFETYLIVIKLVFYLLWHLNYGDLRILFPDKLGSTFEVSSKLSKSHPTSLSS